MKTKPTIRPWDADIRCTYWTSPLGPMLLAARGAALHGVWFVGQRHAPAVTWCEETLPVLEQAQHQLQAYFAGRLKQFTLPLDPLPGTPFQRAVWHGLQQLEWGETTSYGALAHAVDRPAAVRAVGAAVGRNPWSIVVPCHRVLGTTGALTGYAGGLDRKRALLALESGTPLPAR